MNTPFLTKTRAHGGGQQKSPAVWTSAVWRGRCSCAVSHAATLHCNQGNDLPVPLLSPAYLRYKLDLKYSNFLNAILVLNCGQNEELLLMKKE